MIIFYKNYEGMSSSQNQSIEIYTIDTEESRRLLFNESDIESYNWNTHEIEFTSTFLNIKNVKISDGLNIEGGSKILKCANNERFALFVNNKKIYEGIFEPPAYSSFLPGGAMITDVGTGIAIYVNYGDDPRSNTELYESLKQNELLK